MKTTLITLLLGLIGSSLFAQDFSKSPWHIVADDIDPANYYGVTVANGMVGLVSSATPLQVDAVVLNGVYDYYERGKVSNILKTFNHVNMQLVVDGTFVDQRSISNYRQTLDMQHAELKTTFYIDDRAEVSHTMMSLRQLPYTSLIVVEVTANKNLEIQPASVIQAPNHLVDVRNFYSQVDRPHVLLNLMTSVAESPSGKHTVAVSNSFIFEEHHGEEPHLIHEDWDFNRHLLKFTKSIKKGETYRFAVVASATSTAHYQDPESEAERLTTYARLQDLDELISDHRADWAELWESDIQVAGDLQVQKDVRSALYHLYSFAREGTALSLSPMGLSGLGYNGHVFWDTELWMYPPLLMLQPEIARSLLDYRFERLEAAKQNAFAHGFDGAMFPWESAEDGSEDTPPWALTGAFEHHITGCIAWAFWQYYLVTKDQEWLAEKGYPLLKEAADFWVSRSDLGDDGMYHINNVIAADEWAENVDDNAFTNGVAKATLEYATEAAKLLGKRPDADWMMVAEKLVILTFENGVTREHATYEGEMIKQADVNLLSYPLGVITDRDQMKRDLDYYEPTMSPDGPAMGPSVLSILHNVFGDVEKAEANFYRGYRPNEVPPFAVISETAGGTNPYFATGAGGMLQAALSGFGGLRVTDKGIEQVESVIPKSWKRVTITGVGVEDKTFTVK